MLDENLPAFFLKPSSTGIKHHREFYLSHHGSDPAPAYTLQHADPASPSAAHKNCYAAALFDAYNPEVLFGEVLARPGWTQPTQGAGGAGEPPQPIMPNEFTVQMYNPDQQVRVEVKSKWAGSDSYEFTMPQDVFRTPSNSSLDKGQSDPASLEVTPRINFVWRKESKLNKDLTCYMTGKSTDKKKKARGRDPDIAIALWRQMRELTIYEPNLGRIDMEDPKGLEVVLLLSAVVIKDLYFSTKDQLPDLFNITDGAVRKLSSGGRKLSNPKTHSAAIATANLPSGQMPTNRATPSEIKRNSLPRLQTSPAAQSAASQPPPMADPRSQWALDAETARLKAEQEAEARRAAHRRREKEKADEAERRRLQRLVEEEEKTARRKQAEVDKETERLRRLYGVKPIPQQPNTSRPQVRPGPSGPYLQPIPSGSRPSQRPNVGSNGLYVQPSASASSIMMTGANSGGSNLGVPLGANGRPIHKKKSSFFGLRSVSDDAPQGRTLNKKASAMW